jgi:hypothetical protein
MRIYVATSWRNAHYPRVLGLLRNAGHEVHDFRDPAGHFRWDQVSTDWDAWTTPQFAQALEHPTAIRGFQRDERGLACSQLCVLVLPCGRSAHLEAGYAVGSGKKLVIYVPFGVHFEPELMYCWASLIVWQDEMLIAGVRSLEALRGRA